MNTVSEREIAVRGLIEILDNDAYGNLALREILGRYEDLSRVQRAFITEVINGCIRHLIQLDYIIDTISSTPTKKMKPLILNIMRVSVYQMKFMDKVPVFAICDEAVKLARKFGYAKLSGFVNGVLRNVYRGLDIFLPPALEEDAIEHMRVKFSCQQWIAEHFVREIGLESTVALLESVSKPPQVTILANTKQIALDDLQEILAKEGIVVNKGKLAKNALILSKTANISALPSFLSGYYHVMDESAAFAVNCVEIAPNSRIIDLCAAPGGKTFAAAYASPDASILSHDIHKFKLNLIKLGAKRLGLDNIEVWSGDATKFDVKLASTADLVIVDAPCSGLGTLRRRPDIKLKKTSESIKELADLQRRILAVAWQYVKPGGKLLYSTCTISSAENIDNVNWLLNTFPLKSVDFSGKVPDVPHFSTARDGYIQILPQYFGTDGFFISVFERVGE